MSGAGISGFLAGIPAPTTTSSSSAFPKWLQQALQQTIAAGGSLAQQPFTPFPGPTVAAPSDATKQSWNMAGANVGAWQPDISQAGALTRSATAPITSGDISTFLNPYQDYITGALNRNLQQNVLPGIQDKFVSAGQSRSPQEAEVTNRAVLDNQTAVGQSLAGAYQGALNSLQQERGQQLQGASALGQLGALNTQLGAADTGQVAAAGNAQDQLAQANISSAQNQFQQQQAYPYNQLDWFANLIRGLPTSQAGSSTTSVTSGNVYGPSPLATYAGTLASGAGSAPTSTIFAKGGAVDRDNVVAMSRRRRPQQGGALSRMAA